MAEINKGLAGVDAAASAGRSETQEGGLAELGS